MILQIQAILWFFLWKYQLSWTAVKRWLQYRDDYIHQINEEEEGEEIQIVTITDLPDLYTTIVLYSIIQYSTIQYSTVQYSTDSHYLVNKPQIEN